MPVGGLALTLVPGSALPILEQSAGGMSDTGCEITPLPDPYTAYTYGYPHKSAYGPLLTAVPLREAWRDEDHSRLFLYVHVPFCEMRCGFCNLLTESQPSEEVVEAYLGSLERQSRVVREVFDRPGLRRMALGGGTPTFLSARQLARVLALLSDGWGGDPRKALLSVETSPTTATAERLQVLSDAGTHRLSLGVQSFLDHESRAMGRPQQTTEVYRALETIRKFSFPVLNLDLIYGDPTQTAESWWETLQTALRWEPDELFLYPLYIRPQTGLGRRESSVDNQHRLKLYRQAVEFLATAGWEQVSMRCFRRSQPQGADVADRTGPDQSLEWCCQSDGMVGLGCGARSYTQTLHYSSRFAVSQGGVRTLLRDWIRQDEASFAQASHGVWLTEDDRRRRFVLLSLLQTSGLSAAAYQARFDRPLMDSLPELQSLVEQGWACWKTETLKLTAEGLALSDAIGPWLYAPARRRALEEFAPA